MIKISNDSFDYTFQDLVACGVLVGFAVGYFDGYYFACSPDGKTVIKRKTVNGLMNQLRGRRASGW